MFNIGDEVEVVKEINGGEFGVGHIGYITNIEGEFNQLDGKWWYSDKELKLIIPSLGTFEQIATEIGKLVDEKNAAYGNAVEATLEIFKILYPDGIKVDQYNDALIFVNVIHKICRIARGNKNAFSESPYKDMIGYCLHGLKEE